MTAEVPSKAAVASFRAPLSDRSNYHRGGTEAAGAARKVLSAAFPGSSTPRKTRMRSFHFLFRCSVHERPRTTSLATATSAPLARRRSCR